MTAAAVDIPALVARLKEKEASLGDPLDVPRTTRAYADYWAMRREIAATLSGLMNAPNELARAEADLDAVVQRRREVEQKRDELTALLVGFVDPQAIADLRLRDAELERQRQARRAATPDTPSSAYSRVICHPLASQ